MTVRTVVHSEYNYLSERWNLTVHGLNPDPLRAGYTLCGCAAVDVRSWGDRDNGSPIDCGRCLRSKVLQP